MENRNERQDAVRQMNVNEVCEDGVSSSGYPYVTSINIVAPSSRNCFYPGETEALQIIPFPVDAIDASELRYELSDPEVAVVMPNGLLFAYKPGKCLLTVAGRCTKGEFIIHVNRKPERLILHPSKSFIMSDESCEINASLWPEGAIGRSIKWSIMPQDYGQLRISPDSAKCTLIPNARLQNVANIFVNCEIDNLSEQTVVQVKPVDRQEGVRITCILATIGAFLFCWTSILNVCLWVGFISCHIGKKNDRIGDQIYHKCFVANVIALILTAIVTIAVYTAI